MIENRLKNQRIKKSALERSAGTQRNSEQKNKSVLPDRGKVKATQSDSKIQSEKGKRQGNTKAVNYRKITEGGKETYGSKTRSGKAGGGKAGGGKAGSGKAGGGKAGSKEADSRISNSRISSNKIPNSEKRLDSGNSQQGNSGRSSSRSFVSKSKPSKSPCPVSSRCGGCQLLDVPYAIQLDEKKKRLEQLLKPYCNVVSMTGMEEPYHYRNKVHAVFDHDKKGNPVSGVYEANSHDVVPVEHCLIEAEKADEIIGSIRGMLKSFKIKTYDEDSGYGLLRHVLIRCAFSTREIMVVLVTASPVFPSKNNFVKALRQKHPEITTIIQNVNGKDTSMVLGDKEQVLYGKGYIEDILCGCRFRVSSKSFYQVNPVQTELLYQQAIKAARLTGRETVLDAYCGIGTIGIVAAKQAGKVIGVELNRDAVKDAIQNAKMNDCRNIQFYCNDASKFMVNMAADGGHADVVIMDPPRSGSTEEFIDAVALMKPERVVYVSCGPDTLVRDLGVFEKKGYRAEKAWGFDLFPFTTHVETAVLLVRKA